MELRDQDFRVGDEVVIVYSPLRVECGKVVCLRAHQLSEEVLIKRAPLEHTTGDLKGLIFGNRLSPVYFFHREAVTLDKHGRLTAIDHDYIKPRPKVVYKWSINLLYPECANMEGTWGFDKEPTQEELEKKRTEECATLIECSYWKEQSNK